MEVVGLTVSVAGLAALFSTCMECFEYVELGRNFGKDYERCLLRLRLAELRLSRWGKVLGLTEADESGIKMSVKKSEFDIAETLLAQIKQLFEDAEKLSKPYEQDASKRRATNWDHTDTSLMVFRRLQSKVQDIAVRRQHGTSSLRKARWALFDNGRFEKMIKSLTGFINELVELFPAAKANQQALCKEEARSMRGSEELQLMSTLAENNDDMLRAALREEASSQGHRATNWQAKGNSRVRIGDNNAPGVLSKSVFVSNFGAWENADVWIGNENS